MTCQNGKCEYQGAAIKRIAVPRTQDEIRYGQLWAEIELPKLLKGDEQKC